MTCRYHLGLDVAHTGGVQFAWPQLEPWEVPATCALDVAEMGGMTLDEIGVILNVPRERVRQLQAGALAKIKATLAEWAGSGGGK